MWFCGSPSSRSHPAERHSATTCALDWPAALPATALFLSLFFFSSSPLLLFSSTFTTARSPLESISVSPPAHPDSASLNRFAKFELGPGQPGPNGFSPAPVWATSSPGRLFFFFGQRKVRPPSGARHWTYQQRACEHACSFSSLVVSSSSASSLSHHCRI